MRSAIVGALCLAACPALAAPCPSGTGGANGRFGILKNGVIHGPDGSEFIGRGINVMQGDLSDAADRIPELFPWITAVRVPLYRDALGNFPTGAQLAADVRKLTSKKIVVVLEDHTNNANNGDAGGGAGTVFVGTDLDREQAMYQDVFRFFKDDAYVWGGTNNEPPGSDPVALANWQLTTVNTIRSTGNENPVLLEISGYDVNTINAGMPQSVYSQMYNTIWDVHFYGGNSHLSTDQGVVDQTLSEQAVAAQKITSKGGVVMPVWIGEFGNSQDSHTIDRNADQTIKAVLTGPYSYTAWAWGNGNPGDGLLSGGNLSAYGKQVAAGIDAAAASCGIAPQASTTVIARNQNPTPLTTPLVAPKPDQPPPELPPPPDAASITAAETVRAAGIASSATADVIRQGQAMMGNSR